MPKLVTADQKRLYWERRDAGYSMRASAQVAGFSLTFARTLEKKSHGHRTSVTGSHREVELPQPKRYAELSPEAKRAFGDFAYFQRRYFGRVPIPWQVQAAEQIIELQATTEKEYVVVNAPPGSGKTLLFTHDIPAWLTIRDRAIRGQMGSVTGALAARYTRRLRRTLERVLPEKADDDETRRGTAFDAEATLAEDFGRFKPLDREQWTADSFVVMQYADVGEISEKEATWQSYGIDQGFIGGRYPFIVWDDLVDPRKQATDESREKLQDDWDDLCETRLEPGGLLILQGQRLYANDIYRYNLDKVVPMMVDEDTGDVVEAGPKYHHIKFPAHDESRCDPKVTHRRNALPWPDGCLLSPSRLPWRELATIESNRAEKFQVVYQQEDADLQQVLVHPDWVYGRNGHPGCLDHDRDRLELPDGLDNSVPLFSVVTVDPSPTRYWGIQWWVYHAPSEQRFLMDLLQVRMDAPDFLGWDMNSQRYYGVAEEWVETSRQLKCPISHIVVEINAAQRFLLQYDFVRKWTQTRHVLIVPHSTNRNKSDPDYGVQMLRDFWKYGNVRLPYRENTLGRIMSLKLIKEVTHYPNASTTDQVMAEWFFEFQRVNLFHPVHEPVRQQVPSWVSNPRLFRAG